MTLWDRTPEHDKVIKDAASFRESLEDYSEEWFQRSLRERREKANRRVRAVNVVTTRRKPKIMADGGIV